jgi:uncharacterized protein (DUF2336 family)
MTTTAQTLIADLEAMLVQAPESWRATALRQMADLFVSGADSFNDEHVAVFDEVMSRLIEKVSRPSLAELSSKLAPIDNAPVKVVGTLARNSDIAIYGPILETSKALPDKDLMEIADRDRRDITPLLKIVSRAHISEAVTDVLLRRANPQIQRKIIDNPNARISEAGFARLVTGVNGNKDLAMAIAARSDLPAELRPWLAPVLGQ